MPIESNTSDDEFVLQDHYIGPFMKSQSKMPLLRGENPSQQEYEYRILDTIHNEEISKLQILPSILQKLEDPLVDLDHNFEPLS